MTQAPLLQSVWNLRKGMDLYQTTISDIVYGEQKVIGMIPFEEEPTLPEYSRDLGVFRGKIERTDKDYSNTVLKMSDPMNEGMIRLKRKRLDDDFEKIRIYDAPRKLEVQKDGLWLSHLAIKDFDWYNLLKRTNILS